MAPGCPANDTPLEHAIATTLLTSGVIAAATVVLSTSAPARELSRERPASPVFEAWSAPRLRQVEKVRSAVRPAARVGYAQR